MMPKHNRHITIISYGFMIVFACLLVYFSIFVLRDNSKLLNNPYNKTDDLMADRIKRGNILASGGEILAESLIVQMEMRQEVILMTIYLHMLSATMIRDVQVLNIHIIPICLRLRLIR